MQVPEVEENLREELDELGEATGPNDPATTELDEPINPAGIGAGVGPGAPRRTVR